MFKNTFTTLFASSAIVLSLSGIGCAVDETDSSEASDALSDRVITNVSAFVFDEVTPIAAPQKVKGLLQAITNAKEGALRCLPKKRVELWSAKGLKMGELALMCSPGDAVAATVTAQLDVTMPTGDVAELKVKAKSYIVQVNLKALTAIEAQPLAVGDLTWGATRVDFGPPTGKVVRANTPQDVSKILAAIGGDTVPDPAAPIARCMPDYTMKIFRGDRQLAVASATCGGGTIEGTIGAREGGTTLKGGLKKIDLPALKTLYATLSKDSTPLLCSTSLKCPIGMKCVDAGRLFVDGTGECQ